VDTTVVTTEIERALGAQLRLTGGESVVAEVAEAMMVALEPAIDRAVALLAAQAAEEVEAQLPGRRVSIELREGTPVLVVGGAEVPAPVDTNDLEARITLRLSEELKNVVEEAARETGDSVNTFVVKTLMGKVVDRRMGRHFTGMIET